jgi:hypothetical protein
MIGYDVFSSLPTPGLVATKEVLFVACGFQNDFQAEKYPKSIDDMVAPNMLESETIVVDEIVVDILGCSTIESTLDPKPISLDQPTQPSVPYHHPHHRINENHAFIYLPKIRERQNRGPVPTIRINCGWIDEWSWVPMNRCLKSSYHFVSLFVWM